MDYYKELILPVIFGIIGICAMFADVSWLVLVAVGLLEMSLCKLMIEFVLTKVESQKLRIGYWSIPATLLVISLWCFYEALNILFPLAIPAWLSTTAVAIGLIVLVWFFGFCFIYIIDSIVKFCKGK